MCRLALKTADIPFSPYEVLTGMEAMQEGYDGSGLGLLLRGVSFEDYKYKKEEQIILSGIAHTKAAFKRLQRLMEERGSGARSGLPGPAGTSVVDRRDGHGRLRRRLDA